MFELVAVTNRKLCARTLTEQAEIICRGKYKPDAIILREKDLTAAMYIKLAQKIAPVCSKYGVRLILHSCWQAAAAVKCDGIQLSMELLRSAAFQKARQQFKYVGASVHSRQEALEAVALDADFLTAGHIYRTDCKKGLPGRGIDFLREICTAAGVPVYAIGGIGLEGGKFEELQRCGAAGACIMSGYMLL